MLQRRKMGFVESMKGAQFDILEFDAGDGSASVISSRSFDGFVAPYNAPLIKAAHRAGQRVVYHLCGKIMLMAERAVAMGIDSLETFTPPGMGGDADLAAVGRRIDGRCA